MTGVQTQAVHRIAVIPGDGIGQEVVPAAQVVLEEVGRAHGFGFAWTELDWSCERYARLGAMMPEDGIEQLREHDQVFLGAVGFPGVPDHVSLWGLLIPIRRAFRQYVNLRPVKLLRGMTSPLRDVADGGIDMLVVRENSEGEYSEMGGRFGRGTPGEFAVQESVFTRAGIERVTRYALDLAESRSGRLASATKSNGIVHTMPFWDEVVREQAAARPGVQLSEHHVDALAATFVLDPGRFDVVVASNLFGDILTDIGGAVMGSIGIAPSANLNPEGEFPSMFEPVHGSAPDIAGQGKANPLGQVWSGAMMLDHLGHPEAAAAVVAAMESVLADSGVRTADLGGRATTEEVTAELLRALRATAPTPG
ncbi:MAG: D-malate dehydrogenase [decarboxylating] [uncultured Frankineae bacterium]|uniref:D-malate dehydrogenase (decarboxylating) n=1 Tax=uncultured Frankineae bacterium TaxID=437475 RepID=A0A6J4L4N7_9ACTN|nr:MAG: D-malate dehydrogenase [decarboxylating] [uncultured Frankineae bacterium]